MGQDLRINITGRRCCGFEILSGITFYVNYSSLSMLKVMRASGRTSSTSNPFNNFLVNVFSVNNSEYPYFISLNLVDYSVIADP